MASSYPPKEDHEKSTPPVTLQRTESQEINASGHVQELPRNFSLVSLAGLGLTVGAVWPASGGSILVAIFNGGPPGKPCGLRKLEMKC